MKLRNCFSHRSVSGICKTLGKSLALLLGVFTVAWAGPITVVNPSFEILPDSGLPNGCGVGCSFSVDFIPGWVNTPFLGLGLSSGQFQPGTDAGNTTFFNALSDGITSAYTTTSGISQTVGVTVQEGVIYTLLADVGWRNDAGPFGNPRLLVNSVFYDGIGIPVQGGWGTFQTTYVGLPADVGLPITIFLDSVTFQGNFDNVRFSDSTEVSAVPEPGSLGLVGVGLLALLGAARAQGVRNRFYHR